jgi:CBS domain-containing protein
MRVQNILTSKGREVVTIKPDTSVRQAIAVLCERRIGAVVITGGDQMIDGIFSERDLIRGINEQGAGVLDRPVRDIMTREVQTCTRFDEVVDVMGLMTRRRFRHIPVVENGKLIGLVSIGDAVKARIADAEHEAEALKEYIATGWRTSFYPDLQKIKPGELNRQCLGVLIHEFGRVAGIRLVIFFTDRGQNQTWLKKSSDGPGETWWSDLGRKLRKNPGKRPFLFPYGQVRAVARTASENLFRFFGFFFKKTVWRYRKLAL